MGVVATGNSKVPHGQITFYSGKNDLWGTRDDISAGCAYGLIGGAYLTISVGNENAVGTSHAVTRDASASSEDRDVREHGARIFEPKLPPLPCSAFNCSCQGFADYYGAIAGEGWGCAPEPAGKQWWSSHGCTERSKSAYCKGPACSLPGHAPCTPSVTCFLCACLYIFSIAWSLVRPTNTTRWWSGACWT
jgi:hypothetical protein